MIQQTGLIDRFGRHVDYIRISVTDRCDRGRFRANQTQLGDPEKPQSRRGAGPGRLCHRKGARHHFIEEMPLGIIDEHDRAEAYYSSDRILSDLRQQYELVATTETTGGPSRYYRISGLQTRVGFISPHSHNFCKQCNRVRLTAEGRLLLCLGQEHSMDLRRVVRANPSFARRHCRSHAAQAERTRFQPAGTTRHFPPY